LKGGRMIARIKVTCAYEIDWKRSRALVEFLDGPHKGRTTDCTILCGVANEQIILGEYDFGPRCDYPAGVFIPLKERAS